MHAVKPPRLRKGDLIGLVSPASTPSPAEKIEKSVRYLEGLGYHVAVGRHAAREHGYLAGTDAERAEDFNTMAWNPEVKAIFALRGGYGTPRILPFIDYKALRRQPKIISGFSDITALQLALYKKCKLATFSGPMPAVEFWNDPDPYTEENFWPLLTSTRKVGALKNPDGEPFTLANPGKSAGVLLGGNLALVVSSFGTPYLPSFRNAILALEEVDEYPHRVDRMFAQIRNAGLLDRASGVLLGKFTSCGPKDPAKPHITTEELLKEFSASTSAPVIGNLQYGHVPKKLTLPLGIQARIDSRTGKIEIIEAATV